MYSKSLNFVFCWNPLCSPSVVLLWDSIVTLQAWLHPYFVLLDFDQQFCTGGNIKKKKSILFFFLN